MCTCICVCQLVETRLQAVPLAEAALRTDMDPEQAAVIESVHTRKLDWPEVGGWYWV